jgi:hypothetical protein
MELRDLENHLEIVAEQYLRSIGVKGQYELIKLTSGFEHRAGQYWHKAEAYLWRIEFADNKDRFLVELMGESHVVWEINKVHMEWVFEITEELQKFDK